MKHSSLAGACLAGGLLWCTTALADIQIPRFFTDGAILQRDAPLTLWGEAEPGEKIQLSVNGAMTATTLAGEDGRWHLEGETYSAGGPHTVVVEGENRITLKDIYFGDVWLASGQSNMEMTVREVRERYPREIAAADNPLIRQFKVPKGVDYREAARDYASGDWQAATPTNVLEFSAVAWFFARDIQAQTGVPVGIINASYGGSAAQAWMSPAALKSFPHYYQQTVANRDPEAVAAIKQRQAERQQQWYAEVDNGDAGLAADPHWYHPAMDTRDWQTIELPGMLQDRGLEPLSGTVWLSKTLHLTWEDDAKPATLRLGRIVDADRVYVNGLEVGSTNNQYPPRVYQLPPFALHKGDNTITVRLTIHNERGGLVPDKPYVLEVGDTEHDLSGEWRYRLGVDYQPQPPTEYWDFMQPAGMYNAMLAPLFKLPLTGVLWYQGESNVGAAEEYRRLLPAMIRDWRRSFDQTLPFVLVQLPGFGEITEEPGESGWAVMRDAQTEALAEPNTAMAVTIDLGEWNDIHPLDKKPVGERLALAARKLVYGEDKLAAESPAAYQMAVEENRVLVSIVQAHGGLESDGEPAGFAIAGADGDFVWAQARLSGDQIEVWSDAVEKPTRVRYAWADFPERANVYGGAGLPLMPFSLERNMENASETE